MGIPDAVGERTSVSSPFARPSATSRATVATSFVASLAASNVRTGPQGSEHRRDQRRGSRSGLFLSAADCPISPCEGGVAVPPPPLVDWEAPRHAWQIACPGWQCRPRQKLLSTSRPSQRKSLHQARSQGPEPASTKRRPAHGHQSLPRLHPPYYQPECSESLPKATAHTLS